MTATEPSIIGARRFTDDTGAADPTLRTTLNAFAKRRAKDREVLAALAPARLLVPVVAVAEATETAPDGSTREKHSDIALPIMIGDDGRRGVLAFTSTDTVKRWRRDARPVPALATEAAQAVRDEGADALVVDVAGPVTFAVEGYFLRLLAETGTVPEAHKDQNVLSAIYRVTHSEPDIDRVRIQQSERADLAVRLELLQRDDAMVQRVAAALRSELQDMLPGNLELSAVIRARGEAEPARPQDA